MTHISSNYPDPIRSPERMEERKARSPSPSEKSKFQQVSGETIDNGAKRKASEKQGLFDIAASVYQTKEPVQSPLSLYENNIKEKEASTINFLKSIPPGPEGDGMRSSIYTNYKNYVSNLKTEIKNDQDLSPEEKETLFNQLDESLKRVYQSMFPSPPSSSPARDAKGM